MGDKHLAFLMPMMIGGFVYWAFNGFKGKYNEELAEEKQNRNFWTGYLLLAIVAIAVVLFLLSK
ncbi:hypothetical protein IQ13_0535 [Lacibacter cauensis]|uniref:Uncharacterized protein n=1 Tax=Lacibacter cauensis TaxID=510947 RepID=A0A562SWL2_9BACT|nr:hypothetical protein [Lacibacter cauensis]TWI85374.1 hypothetical protein IQ13_0535 [Lacibacter cauensis]